VAAVVTVIEPQAQEQPQARLRVDLRRPLLLETTVEDEAAPTEVSHHLQCLSKSRCIMMGDM
jgi:hypothetical protein